MSVAIDFSVFLLLTLFLYVLPGWALLTLFGNKKVPEFAEKLCLSAGISISLSAVLFHIFYQLKIAPGALIAWIPAVAAAVYISFAGIYRHLSFFNKSKSSETPSQNVVKEPDPSSHSDPLFMLVFLVVVALLFVTRFAVVQGMAAPAWGDSVHHTVIVQLLQEQGGLFQSWAPYAPITSMTYHFGFHAAAAVWSWVAGVSSHAAVLMAGQVFGILIILALYPIVSHVSRNRWVGLAAMVVAGFLSPLPAFFTNWGRFTMLAGMIVGLVVLWFFDVVLSNRQPSPNLGMFFLLSLLLAGMGLSQYRFSFVVIAAAGVWALDALWRRRKNLKQWLRSMLFLSASGMTAALLLFPWYKITQSNKLISAVAGMRGADLKRLASRSDIGLWNHLDIYYPEIFWILALLCLIPAFIFIPRLARLIILWSGLSFLFANPHLMGISWGMGWLRNENLVFAFFIPFSILIGCIVGSIWKILNKKPLGVLILICSIALALVLGTGIQLRIVDPFFQMVEPSDTAAFRWIRQNTPLKSRFLVNGFVIGDGNMAYGSDAGWWLPYFTHRDNTVPPAQYLIEQLPAGVEKVSFAEIIREVRNSQGQPDQLTDVLCREGITHIFLGERRGAVGYDIQELVPESWLQGSPHFTLLFHQGKAQVWRFERKGCELP